MLKVLDAREGAGSFPVVNSVCLRMTLSSLMEENRFFELSSKAEHLLVLIDEFTRLQPPHDCDDIHNVFVQRGWRNIKIIACLDAAELGIKGALANGPSFRLWDPNPLLQRVLPMLPKNAFVLDLGCGVCRDAVYMALHGCTVLCVDQRRVLLTKGVELAQRYDLKTLDTSKEDNWLEAVRAGGAIIVHEATLSGNLGLSESLGFRVRPSVIHVSRFLRRNILRDIFDLALDWVIYHHFLEGSDHPSGSDQILRLSELALLAAPEWEVVLDDVMTCRDHRGLRVLSLFAAKRRVTSLI